jgi:propionyl-CoA carboxylase alpha chain
MPGVIVAISVSEGQTVARGASLAIVEAMKMENVLRAERDVTIGRIIAAKGDSLAVDAPIMEFV